MNRQRNMPLWTFTVIDPLGIVNSYGFPKRETALEMAAEFRKGGSFDAVSDVRLCQAPRVWAKPRIAEAE